MDDWRLLRQYLDEGSEAAFSRLVARHIKMVYWACRRELNNDQLAEDATQTVFLNLARRAPAIQPHGSIAGWLFTTACNAAKNARKLDTRRRHYEQEAAIAMYESTTGTPDWSSVEPWLNEGLLQLSAGDRELVLLRYFEGASLSDVARAVGIAEPAARKRVSRAVDRLRQYLARREATVTSAVLLAWLAEHSAKAAPAGCQAAVLHALKTNAPAPILHTPNPLLGKGLLIVSTTKAIAAGSAAIILILAITIFAVHRAHSGPLNVAWQGASVVTTTPSQVTWNVPPAPDAASQQAQQQIKAQLIVVAEACSSQDINKLMSVISPDVDIRNGSTNVLHNAELHYNDIKEGGSAWLSQGPISVNMVVNSCLANGNTAKVTFGNHGIIAVNKNGQTFNPNSWTFEKVNGQWLITGL